MTSIYEHLLQVFYNLSTRACVKYSRIPAIYFLPVLHINRIHYSENYSNFCLSYKSSIAKFAKVLTILPFKSLYILFNSVCFSFAYRRPSYSSFAPQRVFLSHFNRSNDNLLNHVFRSVSPSSFDLHVVTSSLYVKEQFNCQFFIPDNSSTVFCRPYAKPFVEIGYILSSIFSVVFILYEFLRADSHAVRLFWINVAIQLLSFQSAIPRRLAFNLNWLFELISCDIFDAFVTHEGYSWEHSAMCFFSRLRIPVSLYCHAPITPSNLSCFRNCLPSFYCMDLYVQNQYSLKLFADRYSSSFRIPSFHVYESLPSAKPVGDLGAPRHSSGW